MRWGNFGKENFGGNLRCCKLLKGLITSYRHKTTRFIKHETNTTILPLYLHLYMRSMNNFVYTLVKLKTHNSGGLDQSMKKIHEKSNWTINIKPKYLQAAITGRSAATAGSLNQRHTLKNSIWIGCDLPCCHAHRFRKEEIWHTKGLSSVFLSDCRLKLSE